MDLRHPQIASTVENGQMDQLKQIRSSLMSTNPSGYDSMEEIHHGVKVTSLND